MKAHESDGPIFCFVLQLYFHLSFSTTFTMPPKAKDKLTDAEKKKIKQENKGARTGGDHHLEILVLPCHSLPRLVDHPLSCEDRRVVVFSPHLGLLATV